MLVTSLLFLNTYFSFGHKKKFEEINLKFFGKVTLRLLRLISYYKILIKNKVFNKTIKNLVRLGRNIFFFKICNF